MLKWSRLVVQVPSVCRGINNNTGAITKVCRETYVRTYPTTLVFPDGSTIKIRYKEPRQIIKLPFNVQSLTAEEKRRRLEARKPKKQVEKLDDYDDDFDSFKYIKMANK